MKRIAYSYKRWSSTLQGKDHTEERQTELAEEYARREGLTLDAKRTMVDEGVSGFRPRRYFSDQVKVVPFTPTCQDYFLGNSR